MSDQVEQAEKGGFNLPEIRVASLGALVALGAGLVCGLVLSRFPAALPVVRVIEPLGTLWLKGLQMTILPLVVALLVLGLVQTAAAARAGAMARRAIFWILGFYLVSGAVAVVVMPLWLKMWPIPGSAAGALAGSTAQNAGPVPGLSEFLLAVLPSNIASAAAGGEMLPVVVFFAVFALAMGKLPEGPRRHMIGFFEALAGIMMVMIGWVLSIAPIGVFALALGLAVKTGTAAVGALAHYVTLVAGIGGLVLLSAPVIAVVAGRLALGRYLRAMLPVSVVAASTQSSLASLPAMLSACSRLGIRSSSAEFSLPLCVALFRATGPAMNLAVVIYVAHLTGTPLGVSAMLAGIAVAALTELGTPSLPGSISFVLSIGPVAIAMGVPVGPLALLVAVEMLPDLMRTLGNVFMDVAVTSSVDRAGKAD
ncbi:dicarboxylate/amino acid:cation symporter [Novosphingobium humi]|uniref:Cation:dicarboxylase symporter family transporter n=1 Tax=Novosphingobium humi TaxID=2282397 RepID=A0ABY7TYN1_9SPHN|nr:cation:dicarboxylase symporter family transporter [Novosphingobium humi]WCT77727.1 cation:dicarboxylase symporter family transporter [Novosphingobium humi]